MPPTSAVSKRRRRAGIALVAVVALIGAVTTAFVTGSAQHAEDRYAAQLMDRYTSDLSRAITTEIQRYGDTLADVATALGAQADLEADDFTWIATRISTRRMPGATSLGFVVTAPDQGVPALQAYWRGKGATGLTLQPVGTGLEHAFTIFARSLDGRPAPAGADLTAVPEAREALTDARYTGNLAVSRAYVLAADRELPITEQQQSFSFAVPVYFLGGTFRGWLTMGVHGGDLLGETLRTQAHGAVAAQLVDPSGSKPVTVAGVTGGPGPAALERRTWIGAGLRTWQLQVRPTAVLLQETDRDIAGITFAVAVLITLLATALVGLLTGARNRAMSRVDAATAALRRDIERRQEVEDRLREREQELQRMALHDPLTGLANRAGLDARLAAVVGTRTDLALLLIDLDDFKLVNDAYGHAAGDIVLTHFAELLRGAVRESDVAARIGGDEFVLLLTDMPDAGRALAAGQRILAAAAAAPVRLGDDLVPVRASVGIATTREQDSAKELMRRADTAMYEAKRVGTHEVRLHDPAMTDQRAADAQLGEDLVLAVENGELTVLYQPLVDLADGRPLGVEALVRWQHPTLGVVSPARFIPIAERTGTIGAVGLAVLDQACRQVASWGSELYVSVNVSPRQLRDPNLVRDVLTVLGRTGLAPARLVLEITESALVDDKAAIDMLAAFRAHGIRVAVDDFGTGYSSLHYLTRLPVDILKIDRSFVAELNGTPEGAGITEAILRLSHALHLTTVAEGIETTAQAAELQLLGCGIGQGYLFAKPLPAEEVLSVLTRPSPPPSSPS
ncbi:bifunctional diguanylate cyclase/phosphodiesterase [Actinoplanes sp. N902-109]|uniref:putative bifunctional diguanylate cyclase/phosphodiesterase n=1 Tax=Actinoplanes sp. (strain N902-109) TaxID=649831 RepID=UPI00032952FE|nr:bifunctional diguanylate cyclase/phosphodiesterase [Actinoplanes sp. N902-109]AGL20217.1 two-component response regulator [Actinoplanes sp. N902-109]